MAINEELIARGMNRLDLRSQEARAMEVVETLKDIYFLRYTLISEERLNELLKTLEFYLPKNKADAKMGKELLAKIERWSPPPGGARPTNG